MTRMIENLAVYSYDLSFLSQKNTTFPNKGLLKPKPENNDHDIDQAVKILVVEDEGIVALDLKFTLKNLGYRVVGVAGTGERAIRLVTETQPDLVLMDIRLQGKIDGITAAAQIRTVVGTPVVFLTANSDEETRERAQQTNPSGYLIKPFVGWKLQDTINLALGLNNGVM